MGCNQTDSIADFGIFRKVYDNFYLLEKVAISVITDKAMNISNEKAMEIVDNFKNFIEAFPILYKSTRICGYLSRTKTNDVLSSFMNLLFDDSRYPPIITNFGAINELSRQEYLLDLKSNYTKEFYNTQTVYVIYNMFYDFGIGIIKKIIEHYNKFITQLDKGLFKLGTIYKLQYGTLVKRIWVVNKRTEHYFNMIIKKFLIFLRKDLVKMNIDGFGCEKIVRRIIKSFDWRLGCNNLDYGKVF